MNNIVEIAHAVAVESAKGILWKVIKRPRKEVGL